MNSPLRTSARRVLGACVGFLLLARPAFPTNYDEAKVGTYILPDPLVGTDGARVQTADQWFSRRRPELLAAYRSEVFGHTPKAAPKYLNVWEVSTNALGGTAVRKQVEINFSGTADGPFAHLLLYTPAGRTASPTFLCLQFNGNYTAIDDPAVAIFPVWDGKTGLPALRETPLEANMRGIGKLPPPLRAAMASP